MKRSAASEFALLDSESAIGTTVAIRGIIGASL